MAQKTKKYYLTKDILFLYRMHCEKEKCNDEIAVELFHVEVADENYLIGRADP